MKGKEEILAKCIDEVLSGRSTVKDCLGHYPELRNELRPLLEIALSIQPPKAVPSPEFRYRLRSRLLEIMGTIKAVERRKEGAHRGSFPVLPIRAVAILLLVFVILTTGVSGVYASQSSLPGDILYPVKTNVEKLQIAVTVNPEEKAYLHLKLVQRRVDEVAIQVSLNRSPDVSGLASLPAQTDAALREIEKATPDDTSAFLSHLAESAINQQIILGSLLTVGLETGNDAMQQAMDIVQRTSLVAQAAYNNPDFLHTSPSVRDKSLEQGRFKVDGTLLSVAGQTWNIGGLILLNVHYSGEMPSISSRVKIEGLNKNKEIFIIKLEQEEDAQKEVKIEGLFKGTDESGEKWYVGEMPIDAPEDKTPPAEGEKIELRAVSQDGSLAIKDVKKEDEDEHEREHEAKVEGRLSTVDTTNKVITVKVAGALISINVSSAEIRTKDNKEVKLSELTSLIGKEIKARGLVKKDSTLYAKDVRIDVEKWGEEKRDEERSDEEKSSD